MTGTLVAVEPSEEETALSGLPAAFIEDKVPLLEPPVEPPRLTAAEAELLRGDTRHPVVGTLDLFERIGGRNG